jgi:hypothetical protein
MSSHPVGTAFTLRIPRPVASSKNRRRLFARGRRVVSLPSAQAVDDVGMIRTAAWALTGGRMPFDSDDALSLTYTHELDLDELVVTVQKIGVLPARGPKGTKRDLHGMVETIADALQGTLYPDDRQIDSVSGARLRRQP